MHARDLHHDDGDRGGAIGYLVGEENAGMPLHVHVMNQARLGVGLEGVGVADRPISRRLLREERRQGRAVGKQGDGMDPIIVHPDIKRMLMQMRALTAARDDLLRHAVALDVAVRTKGRQGERRGRARGALLTPIARRFPPTRQRGGLSRRAVHGAWASSKRPARQYSRDAASPRSMRHQRHPGDRSRHRKLAANGGARFPLLDELAVSWPGRGLQDPASALRPPNCATRSARSIAQPLATGARRHRAERRARRRDALSACSDRHRRCYLAANLAARAKPLAITRAM